MYFLRRFLPLLILSLFVQLGYSAKHFKFEGIAMGSSQTEFFSKLQKKGFQAISQPEFITDTANIASYYWGTYKGHSGTILAVSGVRKNKNKADKLVVYLDASTSWHSLYDKYYKIKQSLTKEFGQPKECREMFHINGQPKTDDDLFLEVKHGNCEYLSIFSSKRGVVMLSIVYKKGEARVNVVYLDQETVGGSMQHSH